MTKKDTTTNDPEDSAERPSALGPFIRAQREMADLSLRQLSDLTEVSNAYLSQIERGLHQPSLRVLKSVSNALGIAPSVMMRRAGLGGDVEADDGEGEAAVSSVPEAIAADELLSDAEKDALLSVYRSYTAAKA